MTEQQDHEFPLPLYVAFHTVAQEERYQNMKTWQQWKGRKKYDRNKKRI